MNTYNYNPYKEDYYQNYNQTGVNYRQTAVPNQNIPPQGNSPINEEEQYYAENILNMNKGKKVKIYMSFSDSLEWRDRIFEGTLEAWGRDFLLIKTRDNLWNMVWNIYIDFIEFNETVAY